MLSYKITAMSYFESKHMRTAAQQSGEPVSSHEVKPAEHGIKRPADPTALMGWLGLAVLLVTLVPLVLISAYNHSYADDWHYGVWAHLALEDGANIFQLIGVALEQAGKAWFDWQGTYSAIFLMALEPSVFGEQFYVLAAPLVLALFIAGTFFFTHVYLCERMGAPRGVWLGLSSLLVSVQLLLQPSPVEGIFWYNSAVYYTVYNGAALAMLGCLGRICNPVRTRRPRGVMVAYCLLAVFLAGGNFVTALVLVEVMTAIVALLWRSGRRCTLEVLIGYVLLVLGLVVSFVAPGNAVRQETQFPDDNAGVWGTIAGSSAACFQYIWEWNNGLVLLLLVAGIAAAVYVAPRALERGFSFRAPLLVVAATVALFATSFTPTFWAEGYEGPGRVQNCRLDIYLVLLLFDVFYVVGWLKSRTQGSAATNAQLNQAGQASTQVSDIARNLVLCFSLVVLIFACTVSAMASDEELGEKLSSVSAARSLISGKAEAYHEQVLERLNYIETSQASELEVEFYHDIPHVLLMGDIRDNMDNYINYRLCQWYGKDSIIGISSTSASAVGVSND